MNNVMDVLLLLELPLVTCNNLINEFEFFFIFCNLIHKILLKAYKQIGSILISAISLSNSKVIGTAKRA